MRSVAIQVMKPDRASPANHSASFAPPRPMHERDTRDIRDDYLSTILRLVSRAGWLHRHEAAMAIAPLTPLSAATRRAQRALSEAATNNLLRRHQLWNGGCVYSLTNKGRHWLLDRNFLAERTNVNVAEACRIAHRRLATQIVLSGELLGCEGNHERELYRKIDEWKEKYEKLPDATLTWTENDTSYISWHEVDMSKRRRGYVRGIATLIRRIHFAQGYVWDRKLNVMVFHVNDGPAKSQLVQQLARLWSELGWAQADDMRGLNPYETAKADLLERRFLLTPKDSCFYVLLEDLPPPDYWPLRDGILLPWRYAGIEELPFQTVWGEAYHQQGAKEALVEASTR